MRYRCLLLDFDGTIADTIGQAFIILNELSEEYGFRKLQQEEIQQAKNMSVTEFIRFMEIPKMRVPSLLTRGKRRLSQRMDQIQPIGGMRELILAAREQTETLGILTSNSQENVNQFLERQDLAVFDFVSTVSKLSGKAKYIKSILRTFDLQEHELLYVGDEIRDVKASKKAGVAVAAVTWGFNSEEALRSYYPDFCLDDPVELLKVFQGKLPKSREGTL